MSFSRRQVLVGSATVAAVGLAGCTTDSSWSGPSSSGGSTPGEAAAGSVGTAGSGRPSEIDRVLPASTLLAVGNGQVLRLGAAPDTVQLVDHGAPAWSVGGTGSDVGQFHRISGAALGPDDTFWIVDTGNRRVQVLTPTGEVVKVIGAVDSGPPPLSRPLAVAVAADGRSFVADAARSGVVPFAVDGTAGELIGGHGSDHPFAGVTALEVVADELAVVEALVPLVQIRDLDGSWVRNIALPRHFAVVDFAVDGDRIFLVSHDGRLVRTTLDGSTDAGEVEVLGHVGANARGLHLGPDGLIVAAHPTTLGAVQ